VFHCSERTITLHPAPKLTTFQQIFQQQMPLFYNLTFTPVNFLPHLFNYHSNHFFLLSLTYNPTFAPSLSSHEMDPSIDIFAGTKFNMATITGSPNYSLRAHIYTSSILSAPDVTTVSVLLGSLVSPLCYFNARVT
jgi:hypothetical protein